LKAYRKFERLANLHTDFPGIHVRLCIPSIIFYFSFTVHFCILFYLFHSLALKQHSGSNAPVFFSMPGYRVVKTCRMPELGSFSAREPSIIGLLRKMTQKDKASCDSTPLCTLHCDFCGILLAISQAHIHLYKPAHTCTHTHPHTLHSDFRMLQCAAVCCSVCSVL